MTAPVRDRGHRNSNERGSAANRRARKQWLLDKFGDGTTARCHECGSLVDLLTMFVDRIIPAHKGGTYRRNNIRPHCRTCSCRQGAAMKHVAAKRKTARKAR